MIRCKAWRAGRGNGQGTERKESRSAREFAPNLRRQLRYLELLPRPLQGTVSRVRSTSLTRPCHPRARVGKRTNTHARARTLLPQRVLTLAPTSERGCSPRCVRKSRSSLAFREIRGSVARSPLLTRPARSSAVVRVCIRSAPEDLVRRITMRVCFRVWAIDVTRLLAASQRLSVSSFGTSGSPPYVPRNAAT